MFRICIHDLVQILIPWRSLKSSLRGMDLMILLWSIFLVVLKILFWVAFKFALEVAPVPRAFVTLERAFVSVMVSKPERTHILVF